MDVLISRVVGPVLQLIGAVGVCVGTAMWLGAAAAWIIAGLFLVVIGTVMELSPEPGEEVTISDEGTGTTD